MHERLATAAMGTRFELVLEARDAAHARAAGETALEEIERCDARWSVFRSDSLLSRVNREAFAHDVALDGVTFELLEACLRFQQATQGAFDIAVGARMREFRSGALSPATERCGAFELDAARRSVRFTREGTSLDLGAIAKGEALERAAEVLREAGVERALLHGGTSSVLALGAPSGASGWRVQLAGFDADSSNLDLCERALSVSAPHGRTLRVGERTLGHVLDPHSGAPLPPFARCAVLGPSARECEAWSTAALVLLARGLDPRELAPAHLELRATRAPTDPQRADSAPTLHPRANDALREPLCPTPR
jgi:thiamine biosynthesis lipoprotein